MASRRRSPKPQINVPVAMISRVALVKYRTQGPYFRMALMSSNDPRPPGVINAAR